MNHGRDNDKSIKMQDSKKMPPTKKCEGDSPKTIILTISHTSHAVSLPSNLNQSVHRGPPEIQETGTVKLHRPPEIQENRGSEGVALWVIPRNTCKQFMILAMGC